MIPKVGTVAGCFVPDGTIRRSNRVRVMRGGSIIYDGATASLKHHKDDAREARAGTECGLRIENFNDVKVGDVLESYSVEERPDTL